MMSMRLRFGPMGGVATLGVALLVGALWSGCSGDASPKTKNPFNTGGGGEAGTATTGGGGNGTGGQVDVCPGGTLCGDVCTQTDYDPNNCGACDNVCDAGLVCTEGQCAVACMGGTVPCGELCVNLANNPEHCGMCDNACPQGQVCAAGKCGLTCEEGGGTDCDGLCVNTDTDTKNCGACNNECAPGEICAAGLCQLNCVGGTKLCGTVCVDTNTDPKNCGDCDKACQVGEVCSVGVCSFDCVGNTTKCNNLCVDTKVDPMNCGACDKVCKQDEVCTNSVCTSVCGGTLVKCGNSCVDLTSDKAHCGACNAACKTNESCINSKCVGCDSNTTDCDGDGWLVADGDCCDQVGTCAAQPELVNPGAIEVVGNGIDDNCNGLLDLFDLSDTVSCDNGLSSASNTATDYAKALGLCKTTVESPPTKKQKTWGLIDAKLLKADGNALPDNKAKSLRASFGQIQPATLEGQRVVVLASGIAADAIQTNPGPIGGASNTHSPANDANISTCTSPLCIKDWFGTANLPLKKANELPVAPNCGQGNAGSPSTPNDSVMLYVRLRAPTNAKAFSFNSYFLSAEYPEYVCSAYNDQFIVLVDTPKPATPIPNPVDKNLMVYNDGTQKWPVGINIASGTSLFSVCESQTTNPACWDTSVSPASCFLGAAQLADTGFGKTTGCTVGGGTFWLTTSGNIVPGDILELRFVVWDVGDHILDSLAIIDGFKWLANATMPGTEG